MAIKIGDAVLFVGLKGTKTALGQVDKFVNGARNKFKTVGTSITSIGKKVSIFGAGVVAATAGVLKVASDFESAFAGVRKTVELTETEFGVLRKGLLDMSKKIPISAKQLAGIAEIAGQMGIKGVKNIQKFTRTIADLGATTDLSFEQGAKQLSRFINITGGAQGNIDRIASAIVDLGNNFATTESEIASMALRLAAAGTVAGATQDEILGIAAAATSLGINAELGGTAIGRIFRMIQDAAGGGGPLKEFAKVAGLTNDEFQRMSETAPVEALQSFLEGLKGLRAEGVNTNNTLKEMGIEQIRLVEVINLLSLGSDVLSDALKKSETAYEENTALAKEAEKRYKTFESAIRVLINTFKNLIIQVGSPFLEPLTNFIKNSAIPALSDMADWVVKNQEKILAFASDLAGKVGKEIKSFATDSILPVIDKIKEWIKVNPELATSIAKWGSVVIALSPIIGPFLIVLGGLVTVVAALANPFLLAAAGGIALGVAGAGALEKIKPLAAAFDKIAGAAVKMTNAVKKAVAAINSIPSAPKLGFTAFTPIGAAAQVAGTLSAVSGFGTGPQLGAGVTPRQSGGFTGSGPTLVGERGPELIRPPVGSRVFSNEESRAMGGGGGSISFEFNFNGPVGSPEETKNTIMNVLLQAEHDGLFTFGANA